MHALFLDFSQLPERPHLKTAGVGQDGPSPAHEIVQSFELLDDGGAGPQPEVKGVTENDLRADVGQVLRRHRFHCAVGADGHEDRRFDDTMIQMQTTATRVAVGAVSG